MALKLPDEEKCQFFERLQRKKNAAILHKQ